MEIDCLLIRKLLETDLKLCWKNKLTTALYNPFKEILKKNRRLKISFFGIA